MANKHRKTPVTEVWTEEEINELLTKNERPTSHIYVALDSDILRSLAFADMLIYKKQDILTNPDAQKDLIIREHGPEIIKLLNMAKKDEIRFFIPRTVFGESRDSKSLKSFMARKCYFVDPRSKEYRRYKDRSSTLASAYCQSYCDNYGNWQDAPMAATYNEAAGKKVPKNDAFIMAQATVAGCHFMLTNNRKDFVFNKKIDDGPTKTRQRGIININIRHGYFTYDDYSNTPITTRPVDLGLLVNILEAHKDGYLQANDENMRLGKEIDLSDVLG